MPENDLSEIQQLKSRLAQLEARNDRQNTLVSSTIHADNQPRMVVFLGVALLIAIIVGSIIVVISKNNLPKAALAVNPSTITIPSADAQSVPKGTNWTYENARDEMTDRTSYLACVVSDGEVNLEPPYSSQPTELCIRRQPRHGIDVLLRLTESGQFMCTSYEGCSVKIRFDGGPVQTFSATTPSDGSDNTLFIENKARFVSELEKASVVRVEAVFYRAGSQKMTFKSKAFDPIQAGLRGEAPTPRATVLSPPAKSPPGRLKVGTGASSRPNPDSASNQGLPVVAASHQPSPDVTVITNPDWSQRPSGDDVARYYPERAQRLGVAGRAEISCGVLASGKLSDCSITSEDPSDQGFGDAAMKLSRYFTMKPMAKDGAPTSGRTVHIPVRFVLPKDG